MPTYDYACRDCGDFDALRRVAERDRPAACPRCGSASPRVFAAAPRLALMEGGTRSAMQRNEQARHEPGSSRDYARLRHPAGCGCCRPGQRGATATARDGSKAFPARRPWMISH